MLNLDGVEPLLPVGDPATVVPLGCHTDDGQITGVVVVVAVLVVVEVIVVVLVVVLVV